MRFELPRNMFLIRRRVSHISTNEHTFSIKDRRIVQAMIRTVKLGITLQQYIRNRTTVRPLPEHCATFDALR